MTIKFVSIGMILGMVWRLAGSSIAGVTYRDDFDFERRYSRVHECDPFYWHPLHLPEECADMYEELIRSNLPVRKVRTPMAGITQFQPVRIPASFASYGQFQYQYPTEPQFFEETFLEEDTPDSSELTPYEKMIISVQKDIKNIPSVPSVRNMPNFGPVALYQQPISQASADMIETVAKTYTRVSDEKGKKKGNKKGKKQDRRIEGMRWKEIVKRISQYKKKGWRKIHNGDIISYSRQ